MNNQEMKKIKLDEIDHQILDILIDNARIPFTDISKKLLVSAGTVHVRVKKMEDAGILKGSSLNLDYEKLGYSPDEIEIHLYIIFISPFLYALMTVLSSVVMILRFIVAFIT